MAREDTAESGRATPQTGGIRNLKASDLPMTAHVRVLGVDITVHQEAMYADVHEDGHHGGLDGDIEIRAWQGGLLGERCRRDVAAWARRNLFNGAGPA